MDLKFKILSLLKDGHTQKEISVILKEQNINPNSESMVEKYIKSIKDEYKAQTLFQLAFILMKDDYFSFKFKNDN